MSTSKKLIVALVLLILLVGGWVFMNNVKSEQLVEEASQQLEQVEQSSTEVAENAEESYQHSHATNSAEQGTIVDLPINPILGRRGVGDPNAPVQIREYFSLTCNHCSSFYTGTYQELKTKYIDTGKVYFIYEEFPLNGPALYGSKIARCLPQERYIGFIDLLLRNQDKWAFSGDFKTALQQNAKLAGMSDEEFNACFDNEELQQAIATEIKTAMDSWNISSTPSFVINNGERIIRGGQPLATFDLVIEELTSSDDTQIMDSEQEALGGTTETGEPEMQAIEE